MELKKLEMVYWPIDRLIQYENNTKTHPNTQVNEIADSIRNYGFDQPIAVDTTGIIIKGHGRLLAAKSLGLKEVPVIVRDDLSLIQAAASRIKDNKVAESPWDENLLPIELNMLQANGVDIEEELGFTSDEIDEIFKNQNKADDEKNEDEDKIPDLPYDPITKPGDIWILGNHRLMCGDSTMVDNVDALLNKNNPVLMVTDPPYGVKYDPEWRDKANLGVGERSRGKVENDHIIDWTDAYSLFTGDVAYVWHAGIYSSDIAIHLNNCGFKIVSQIIWVKQHFALSRGDYHWQHEPCWYVVRKGKKHNWQGARDQATTWNISNNNSFGNDNAEKTWGHGTQKPVECMARPILNNSQKNDYIYDPFGGSGTTLIACEKLNRKCLMMEISPAYCDVIIKRWEEFTNMKAVREIKEPHHE